MVSPVVWAEDGTPHSTHFADVYRSRGTDGQGGWAQARQVFLGGCGLWPTDGSAPARAWADQAQWHVLETGFGLGLNFLATWHAWLHDPQRPQRLFFTSIEAWPVGPEDIRRGCAGFAPLQGLADALAQQWHTLLPGVHRLVFEGGQVQLTVCIGTAHAMLPTLDTPVDSVFLDGFSPDLNPDLWDLAVLKGVARLCRPGTRLATWCLARSLRDHLDTVGFVWEKAPGLPPKRHRLQARFDPHWAPRQNRSLRSARGTTSPPHALVVGAGLSGAACAHSLAQRGWQVTVLDQNAAPAQGASGLPAGLFAPHVSPDDAPLSRLTRAGIRALHQRAQALLSLGQDWQTCGVLEHQLQGKHRLPKPERWEPHGNGSSQPASAAQRAAVGLQATAPALWHAQSGWLRPRALVLAQLRHPSITWCGNTTVTGLQRDSQGRWHIQTQHPGAVHGAEHVVLATGYATRALLDHGAWAKLPLHALRGQVSWGHIDDLDARQQAALPKLPVNGHGSWIGGVPGPDGLAAWVSGATFERGVDSTETRASDQHANADKLQGLLPDWGALLAPAFAQANAWAGVRCTVPDRLPVVGEVAPGLAVCTGMGARGLTLSVLCAEVLAAQWLGEPWPIEPGLARALLATRYRQDRP